jgi:beta-N-acetylhexosaminidase
MPFPDSRKKSPRSRAPGRALLLFVLLIANLFSAVSPALGASETQSDPASQAAALLATLTPEELVGQLFLVTFTGSSASTESQIYDLISNYHVGGVVLRRDMDNFTSAPDTLQSAYALITDLQHAESTASQELRDGVAGGEDFNPAYIPLLVSVSQEGDGYPTDQILGMLSAQPNAMTLGATWNADLAQQSGELLGRELSALGINLLLGPSLDVLESPSPESAGDLGVRSFGGDPYWVGRMGQAYIQGVHSGSNNRVAVVAKHLPGLGDTDRPLEEEVPTVRKSLTQLTQIELPPFFAVTGDAPSADATADAMLLAHIRYQGFQGNIRATTRPLSFDPQAFAELMALPAFADWREAGGVIISDRLGTRAVRRNYDATEQVFNAPLVARDAFLAGNDLLYLSNFVANGDPDSYATIVRTSEYFAQKYREDRAFAERVDESVLRILTLKFKLYPTFVLSRVIPASSQLAGLGQEEDMIFEIGRQAATLLSPSAAELASELPEPPSQFEQIVFITDSYSVQQCTQCPPQSALAISTLAESVLELYGPGAGNLTTAANLTSFSFTQLTHTLDGILVEGEDPLLGNLQRAEWVVFAPLKEDETRSESDALRRLLSERPDLIQNKKVVVFALNAPYYLDATDITRVSAYYGLYSKSGQIADLAARLLYQEITAPGASPVTVEGVGYNLIEALSPNPAQTVPLQVTRLFPVGGNLETSTPEPTIASEGTETASALTFRAGDLLSMQAGPILDRNGHTVPDNTPVNFLITIVISDGNNIQRQVPATTRLGVAVANYSIESEGGLEIVATTLEPAARSDPLHFDVIGINAEGLALQATQTAQAILLATPSAESPSATPSPDDISASQTSILDWFLIVLIAGTSGLFTYQAGINIGRIRWAVRWALTTIIGGLFAGSYLALDLPGSEPILKFSGEWGLVLTVLVGAAIGWAVGIVWREVLRRRRA